jgi:probable O-glycosylation ligase (exosortase A-associated)
MLADNNDFALALVMGIPLVLHLGLAEKRTLLRRSMLACVPLMVLAIVATHSRGAFVSLAAMTLVLAWRSRNRVASFSMIGLVVLLGVIAAPSAYMERISSITQYEEDGSAKGRLAAWVVAGNMIVDKPLFGVGFDKFQRNYREYDDNVTTADDGAVAPLGTRVAHNSYLQVWAECGTLAFAMYISLLVLSFLELRRVRRMAEMRYHTSWIISYAVMFEAALVAFTVGSMFLNRAHFDLYYHFVAIVAVFGVVARRAMEVQPERMPESAGTRPLLRTAPLTGFLRRPAGAS